MTRRLSWFLTNATNGATKRDIVLFENARMD